MKPSFRKPYLPVRGMDRKGSARIAEPSTMPTIRPRTVLLILILAAVVFFTWTSYQFSQASRQSERHNYYYTIDLSYDTTIDNVTFLLPVPELNTTPVFMESILNGSAYGISPDWNLSIVQENGSPMLAIRAARMVPEYHGFPIAIEPGATVLPTTLVPGHEYSPDTPVLMPITIAVMEQVSSPVNTRDPVGHEPLLSPGGPFTTGSCVVPGLQWNRVRPHGPGVYQLYL